MWKPLLAGVLAGVLLFLAFPARSYSVANAPTVEQQLRQVLQIADRDGDGRLSRDEYARFSEAREFDLFDTDGNNYLDQAEFNAAFFRADPVPYTMP